MIMIQIEDPCVYVLVLSGDAAPPFALRPLTVLVTDYFLGLLGSMVNAAESSDMRPV